MRRMVKEELLTFEGKPLFPERRAYTVTYRLSPEEAQLYHDVTEYVREEMNRAERLGARATAGGNVVGFALTVLQRRLASSPEAIYRSLRRRRERLETAPNEERHRRARGRGDGSSTRGLDGPEDVDDLAEAEREELEERVVDQASAPRTIAELEHEIATSPSRGARRAGPRCGEGRQVGGAGRLLQDDNAEMFDGAGGAGS